MKIAIIGLGAASLFCLYKLQKSKHEIHVFDVGQEFIKRKPCPIDTGKLSSCPPVPCFPNCTVADSGGIFNDYKIITSASQVIGGRIYDLIGRTELQQRLDLLKSIVLDHAPIEIPEVTPNIIDLKWIEEKTKDTGLTYHYQSLLHCGTDNAVVINSNILQSIDKTNIVFHWRTQVTSIHKHDKRFIVNSELHRPRKWEDKKDSFDFFDVVIIGVGRGGTRWLTEQKFYQELNITPGQVDIGVRVETLKDFTKEVDKRFYEPKMYYTTKKYRDTVRNFCSNPGGFVIPENHKSYTLVNGYSKTNEKSENNNFAVLMTQVFTRPFRNPHLYSQHIAQLTNMLAGGGPLVQRLGDLKAGRRTKSLFSNAIRPTLETESGDISLAYPYRVLSGLIEYIEALDKICPGVACNDTLLYSPEIKSFPDRIGLTKNMLTNIPNLYIIGDCSSWSRSIAHSAVGGFLCAESLI